MTLSLCVTSSSAIKIPQSYLTNLEGGTEDKTTLAQKDIRFARTIQRLQRSIITELEKIAIVHLYTLGFRGQDLLSFNLSLNNPSRLAELQQLEYLRTKFDTASAIPEGTYSKRWVAHNILGLSDDEFLRNQRETFYDRKWQQSLEQMAEQDAAGELDGALGGGGADDLLGGGDDLLGGDVGLGDAPADDVPAAEAPEAPAEDESPLLSAPARADDGHISRYKAGGTYERKDGRNDLRSSLGPNRRIFRNQAVPEKASLRSDRSVKPDGAIPDVTFGTKRRNESIYSDSEATLLENTLKVRQLVEQLETKEANKNEAQ